MQRLHKYKKLPPLIPLIMRHGSYVIVVISIIIPALPWNGNSRSYYKIFSSSKEEHGLFSLLMEMVTARLILLSKTHMVQLNLLRSLNVSVTITNVSVGGFLILQKTQKDLEEKENSLILKLTQCKLFWYCFTI